MDIPTVNFINYFIKYKNPNNLNIVWIFYFYGLLLDVSGVDGCGVIVLFTVTD